MFLTTSLANVVAAEVPDAFAHLDTLIVGGEALDPDSIRRIKKHSPKRLVNGYGPTECTTFSSYYIIEDVAPDATSIPIGFPISNTGLHVLDPHRTLLPDGVAGELFVSGPGLALGYLDDDELTESRFVTIDLDGEPTRMYKTGDRVRRLASGALEYLGRVDHQVKLRGFRIELGEIESALAAHEAVLTAVTLVVGQGPARRLAAFVACPDGADEAELKRQLARRVPSYMVPSAITILDAIPLTPSGKADRQKLIEMALEQPASTMPDRHEPHDPELARMLALWADVLGTQTLGSNDDFFASGGNSLLAIELLTKVEQAFGTEVRLSALFGARTPVELLALVSDSPAPTAVSPYVVKLRASSLDPSPPLWLIHPAGGSLVLYEPMISHLGGSFAIYGVEAPGADGAEAPLEDIQALAEHQIQAIRTVQPEGPYRILGYSVGGILGMEMARRLMAGGQTVEFLAAVEAGLPAESQEDLTRMEKYARYLKRRDLGGMAQELVSSMQRRRHKAVVAAAERGTLAANHRRVAEAMARAFHTYSPTPLDIPLHLFFGDETELDVANDLSERWAQLATGGVSMRIVGGSHDNDDVLREPHAKILALAVQSELDKIDRPIASYVDD
jgi:thioesterase domain-containing protein/acyl carrier protein